MDSAYLKESLWLTLLVVFRKALATHVLDALEIVYRNDFCCDTRSLQLCITGAQRAFLLPNRRVNFSIYSLKHTRYLLEAIHDCGNLVGV